MLEKKDVWKDIQRKVGVLRNQQYSDGAWRFAFEGSPMTDAFMIMTLRSLDLKEDKLIGKLAERLRNFQKPNGAWKLYEDEREGNLSATIQAYSALLFSGTAAKGDPEMKKTEQFIIKKGGLHKAHFMTKFMLAVHGQYPWPPLVYVPPALFLLPSSFPLSMYEFSNYARVHLLPMIVCSNKKFFLSNHHTPDLCHLMIRSYEENWFLETRSSPLQAIVNEVKKIASYPSYFQKAGYQCIEKYMLERIENNGTLYSYASSTFYMIYALLALGYKKEHPVIQNAVEGLKSLVVEMDRGHHVQNSPSTVWDTALVSYALQEAGVPEIDPMIQMANSYILKKQHEKKGDWIVHAPNVAPGGWGFSDVNTLVPDNDDTSAALRAITRQALQDRMYRKAWNKGIHWLLGMQNKDGGWGAFEKDANNRILTLIPLENAEDAIIDQSTVDVTGRVLQFLGAYGGLTKDHPAVKKGVHWILSQQAEDGSWYGRWGVCYIYGTWAALTGLCAVGVSHEHPAIQKACRWLETIQQKDGSWGESCRSSEVKRFVSLDYGTPSQTAWAIDALVAASINEKESIQKGISYLLLQNKLSHKVLQYPTGLGLPGQFYIYYESYNHIFPLLALANYLKKYPS
jgi:sporulenol synthase